MDAGISISWEPDPDGSIEHGMQHHRDEEAQFLSLIDAATPAIEVLFDELESAGRKFKTSGAEQRESTGMPIVELTVRCEPPFKQHELKALVERIARLINAGAH
ncbi:MAG: hypothetical protein QM817_32940 [Archangium sp.]